MNETLLKSGVFAGLCLVFAVVGGFAQNPNQNTKPVNFRYSQNPKTRVKAVNQNQIAISAKSAEENSQAAENRTIAVKTFEIAKRAKTAAASPTEIYKIGVGDILIISLQNALPSATNYFTVLPSGAIDYPLAGEMVSIQGLTVEETEDLLGQKIKLYENPQVVVKVREFASHLYTVLGLVEKPGEKFLQREAIPLYVVRAEAVVNSRATNAVIKRAASQTENLDLKNAKSDDVLIFPGDIVEFKSNEPENNNQSAQFYYVGGNVKSAGQKDFHPGITLTQAILASGGLQKTNLKIVVIRRKNQDGLLSPLQFDLKAIKNGKQVDPVLQAGDTIEIEN